MDDRLITLLSALSGIAFGWALTQFSNWYKGRKDDNRIRKEVIFHLLEVSHTLRKITKASPDFLNRILVEFKKIAPHSEPENEKAKINMFMEHVMKPIIIGHINDKVSAIGPDYEKTIKSLSPVDPVIAFYLKGKTSIIEQFDQLLTKVDKKFMEESNYSSDEVPQTAQRLQKFIEGTVYFETINEIEGYAIELASKVGCRLNERVIAVISINKQEESQAEICRVAEAIYASMREQN